MLRDISFTRPELRTPDQVKEFARAKEIINEVHQVSDLFLAQDQTAADLNQGPGAVGLNNVRLDGQKGTFTGVVNGAVFQREGSCDGDKQQTVAILGSAAVEHKYSTDSGAFISQRTFHTENLSLQQNGNSVTYTIEDNLSQSSMSGEHRKGTIAEKVVHHLDTDRICYEKNAGEWHYS